MVRWRQLKFHSTVKVYVLTSHFNELCQSKQNTWQERMCSLPDAPLNHYEYVLSRGTARGVAGRPPPFSNSSGVQTSRKGVVFKGEKTIATMANVHMRSIKETDSIRDVGTCLRTGKVLYRWRAARPSSPKVILDTHCAKRKFESIVRGKHGEFLESAQRGCSLTSSDKKRCAKKALG